MSTVVLVRSSEAWLCLAGKQPESGYRSKQAWCWTCTLPTCRHWGWPKRTSYFPFKVTKHCAWHLKWTRLSLSCNVFVETQVFTAVQAVDILLWSFDKKLSPYCFLTMWSPWRNTNGYVKLISTINLHRLSCATKHLKLEHHNRCDFCFKFWFSNGSFTL